MNNELTVTRSNSLVEASYFLTLNECRLIECAIAKIKNGDVIPSSVKITADEYGEAWGIKKTNSFKELKSASRNLRDRLIKVKNTENGEDWEIRWVDAIGYMEGRGYVKLSFSQYVRPYLEQLKTGFTKYKLLEIKHLKSSNSMRLYGLMMQFKSTGFRVDTVADIRRYFGVEGKYPKWADLNKWVLRKAVSEINELTNYNLAISPIRKGRSVDKVEFSFSLKKQLDIKF